MKLPIIKSKMRYKKSIVAFGGINTTNDFAVGEMEDAVAISHRLFPAITQREKTVLDFKCDSPSCAVFADEECVAASGALYYARKKVADLTQGEKMLAVLGKKIVVFPDKIYYDTHSGEVGDMRGLASTQGAQVTFSDSALSVPDIHVIQSRSVANEIYPKDMDIVTYESATISNGEVAFGKISLKKPSQFVDGTIHNENCKKGEYHIVQSIEYSEEDECYKITSEKVSVTNALKDIFKGLREGDVVEIEGCENLPANNKSATIVSKSDTELVFDEGTFTAGKENAIITIQRKIPDFNCVLSYENRLWGCEGNTIYASMLGDVTNFFRYKNLSTDSYTIESNSAGDFTACAVYQNGCLFFKENECYRLYGSRPSNFQLSQCFEGGILREDAKSIVNVGGKLFYKGLGGIYVYYGANPQRISDKLGNITLKNTAAGSDGRCYFLTADTKDGREEFVWDCEKNLWSRSGIKNVVSYLCFGEDVYRLKSSGIEKTVKEWDEEAQWSITFRPFDEGYYKTKNYSRIHICAELSGGAYICTEIRKDTGVWETVNTSYGNEKKYINIPCVIKGSHEVQLRLSGKGKSIINSIVREFSVN